MAFLDYSGLSHFLDKIKTIFISTTAKGANSGVAELNSSGKVPSSQLAEMIGATSSVAGSSGIVPAPSAGDQNKFLKADGTWDEIKRGTLQKIPFSIATTDWTLSEGIYSTSVTDNIITAVSEEFVIFDSSVLHLTAGISTDKNASTHSVVFTTAVLPVDTITGNVYIVANIGTDVVLNVVSDTLPISHGGTNAITAAGARTNLGVPAKSDFDFNPDVMKAAIMAVSGVTHVLIRMNRSSMTVDGIPGGKIMVLVSGGAKNSICQAIHDTNTSGLETYGTLSADISGETVYMDRIILMPVHVRVQLKGLIAADLTDVTTAINHNIFQYINYSLQPGQALDVSTIRDLVNDGLGALTGNVEAADIYISGAHGISRGIIETEWNKKFTLNSTSEIELQTTTTPTSDALLTQAKEIGKVVNGNTCTDFTLNQGDYVIVKNSSITNITDGLYTYSSSTAKTAGDAVVAAELTAVSGGGLNTLSTAISAKPTYATDMAIGSSNATKVSDAIANLQSGLAYIVGNTNATGVSLAVGQYVYVKWHSTIPEGLRKVKGSNAIANGESITTNNTEACSEGGLNSLFSKIANVMIDGSLTIKSISGSSSQELTLVPSVSGNTTQYFLIFGKIYTNTAVAYMAIYYADEFYLHSLGGTGTITASGTTLTFSQGYPSVTVISTRPFTLE